MLLEIHWVMSVATFGQSQNSLKTYELPKRDEITKVAQQVYQSLVARSVVKRLRLRRNDE